MVGKRHDCIRSHMASLAAAAAQHLNKRSGVNAPFSLAFLTDRTRIPNPEIILRALPRGTAVVLRDYDAHNRVAIARRLKSICTTRGLLLIIGADIDLARSVSADGIHLPAWFDHGGAPFDSLIVTASCHTGRDLDRAAQRGAHLAFLSPAFPTASHPGQAHLGIEEFKKIAAAAPLPVLALGGVDVTNAAQLSATNVAGFAAIGAFSAG